MKIQLEQAGKRFQKYWIFRGMDYCFESGTSYAVLGANGSGKSTLLRSIAGIQALSSGKVIYTDNTGNTLTQATFYPHLSFCAPGMDIVEELTLTEFLEFHFSFKKMIKGLDVPGIIELTGLRHARNKQIGDFSSGMKQRVKLAQAICADTEVLLLDEPCTNLDSAGVAQYLEWMRQFGGGRLVIVASNDPAEYGFCTETLDVAQYA